ncbi:MAG: hypothetical protein NTW86_01945 [Candidatus Sumerlaeota bacterium]|nr:hypothetical protein [Candidatus Sumerlaeota bacterium]
MVAYLRGDRRVADRLAVCLPVDTLVAAACQARKATLVTHNPRHFQAIDGLIIEDWLQ